MPPLSERDRNSVTSRTHGKRKYTEIDLTGVSDAEDDHNAPPKSRSKTQASNMPRVQTAASDNRSLNSARSGYENVYHPYGSLGSSQHSLAERTSWLADEEDVNEIVVSSQDGAEGTDELHLYGDLPTKIVGVQYYRGFANQGEHILLRREPGNPYDSNAIRVDNVNAAQIGHIPRRIAEKLARYIDNRWLHLSGKLAGGIGQYDCLLTIHMYGPDPRSEEGRELTAKMAADKLSTKALKDAERAEKQRQKERQEAEKRQRQEEKKRLAEARRAAAAGQGGRIPESSSSSEWANQMGVTGDGDPATMDDILEASQRFNPRLLSQATDEYGVQEDLLKDMPKAAQPASIATEMLPYQLQALQWLLDQENPLVPAPNSNASVQLWARDSRNSSAFTNLATNFTTKETPTFASGGILADDMGLGKTLEMISLLCADAEKHGRGTTLVISPLSVMSNWSGQISHHVKAKHALNVYTYHGSGRVSMKASDFAKYDVVITTYQTLASDFVNGKGLNIKQSERKLRSTGLYSVDWRRVILDEGHIVRNSQTKGAASVMGLMARSRWVLTGTPIVNSLKDLHSLLRFVGVSGGLELLDIFNSVLVRPLKSGDESAMYLLKAVIKAFTLRRRKEMKFIDLRLPQLEEYIQKIDFSAKEQKRYNALALEGKGLLTRYQNDKEDPKSKAKPTYQHLLEILLRMRQCCNHYQLCAERVGDLLAQLEAEKTVALTPENIKALQDLLQIQIDSQEDCVICLEVLHEPVITPCGHFFGLDCIHRVIEAQKKCPMCRAELKDDSCLVPAAVEGSEEALQEEVDGSSTKLDCMMKILNASRTSGNKTVIFSQWTKFLDIVQDRLAQEGYKFCRLDGTMSAVQRDEALQALEQDTETTIMLASLGVCAVGLNLTAANQIILSDSWWAPAIEDQAVDRVHRLGQKKKTRVFRLVMNGSIEEGTLEIQKEKRKLMMLAFSEQKHKRDAVRAGRLQDIERLLLA